MKINIELSTAIYGKFSDVKLCFTDHDGDHRKVNLSIDFLHLHDFSKDTSSVQFDFFLISTFVYGIDNLISREMYSVDGWARELDVCLPVNNTSAWKGNEELLEKILKFLTGDYWTISFTEIEDIIFFSEKKGRWKQNIPVYIKKEISNISLFSGGLDSLIGVIDCLEKLMLNDKVLFISHFDSNSVGPNTDQTILEGLLTKLYPNKIYWIQSTITLAREDSNGELLKLDDNYRSRSLLFISMGLYLISDDIRTKELIIPENGPISLNYPLTPSRVSTLSTRTTHPYILNVLQELITKIMGPIKINNPYSFQTKGEMVNSCLNPKALENTFADSVSCGKRGRKAHWDIKTGTHHCGVCMPCIYRRAALHKVKLDNQRYGIDILNASSINKYVDMPALFDYLKSNLPIEKIKRDLLVNGSLPFHALNDYASVVSRSRVEILKWMSDKGNSYVKTELGLL